MNDVYTPLIDEPECYARWEAGHAFSAGINSHKHQNFSILLPPPNVTGQLHMGHGFQQTLMDVLSRHYRMRGRNVLWQPGTDHAGIATQLIIERQLQQEGSTKEALGREGFIERAMQWKHTSGQRITQQMRRLGASCDWSRECFTLDPAMNQIVNHVFVRLYHEGFIYKGERLVNWDPVLRTAVSDLEVINAEQEGVLVYIRYPIAGSEATLCVATTRPETLFGDTAIAVHPEDPRWSPYIGSYAQLPLTHRLIPIIADTQVDPSFGTGCVKVTPAHDFNDYGMGQRHALPSISILTASGQLNDNVPPAFQGLSVTEARHRVIEALKALKAIEKIEPHKHMVPKGDRSGAVIEPRLTPQWFMDLTQKGRSAIVQPAIDLVEQGHIRFVPEHWTDTYYHWMHHIQDWCLSRQLWWGHQIPAWYTDTGICFVALQEDQAKHMAAEAGYHGPLTRDPDVLDTWFSSALWPFSTLGWTPQYPRQSNAMLERYLPSSVLVTGFDIIFFWVSRMIMMTKYVTGMPAFKEVYVHGLIRDAEGQKMSKSKGNILDPLDVVQGISAQDLLEKRTKHLLLEQHKARVSQQTQKEFPNGIPAYGADALRFTFCALASPGRDIIFDRQRCEGYRNFCNKLWNAARFVMMNVSAEQYTGNPCLNSVEAVIAHPADQWLCLRYTETCTLIHEHLANYRFDLASAALYHFVWDEWCAWGLEIAKIHLSSDKWQSSARYYLLILLNAILHLAHPFIPFMTEQLWQKLYGHLKLTPEVDFLSFSSLPHLPYAQAGAGSAWMGRCQQWVTQVRQLRTTLGIKPSEKVSLQVKSSLTDSAQTMTELLPYLSGLAKVTEILPVDHVESDHICHLDEHTTIAIPVAINLEEEYQKCQQQLRKLITELSPLESKLNNPQFVERAPTAVVSQTRALYDNKCAQRAQLEQQCQHLRTMIDAS